MRIAQITDLHIAPLGVATRDIDVRANFLRILTAAAETEPDYLMLTGDLCYHDGQMEVYQWIREQLDKTALPYGIIGGNHDDIPLMVSVFDEWAAHLHHDELYYIPHPGIICLDTAKGCCRRRQWDWLKDTLDAYRDHTDLLIFMHHPPAPAGVRYMDDHYPFQEQETAMKLFSEFPGRIAVFSGHYHAERTVQMDNTTLYVTPSIFFQIGPDAAEFKVDHRRPAWRDIHWTRQGLTTAVRYLD